MDDKKVIKISLTTLLLLIFAIILLVAVIIVGIVIFEKNKDGKNSENTKEVLQNNQISNSSQNLIANETNNKTQNESKNKASNQTKNNTLNESESSGNSVQYIDKLVENKGYIYNAQYSPENIIDKNYLNSDGNTYNVSDIVVPYINMVSNDASKINTEVLELYNNLVKEFKICSENKNSYVKSNYQTYITSNIVSIFITIQRGEEQTATEEYLSYNFDLVSGTKLTYDQVYTIAGISNIDEDIKKNIDNLEDFDEYVIEEDRNHTKEEVEARNSEIQTCKDQIFNSYKLSVQNKKLVYFLNSNLKLNIAIDVVVPENNEKYVKVITIN